MTRNPDWGRIGRGANAALRGIAVALLVGLPLLTHAQSDDTEGLEFMVGDEASPESDASSSQQPQSAEAEPAAAEESTAAPAPETAQAASDEPEPVQTIPVEPLRSEPPPPVERAQGRRIEEVVVTAQKREQAIQDVPISMTAISGEMLIEQGVTDVREALQLVPNARVDAAGFFAAPRVRGFTFNNNNKAFEPPVGMVLDGIPHTDVTYFTAALFDISRMEVLRGPQGTSFGKNTTAGLIHLISNSPSDDPGGSLTLERGELGRQRLEAAYGGPLFEGVNVRIAGLLDERDGYIDNTTADVLQSAPDALKDRDRSGLRATV
ncbi:MAG: TonB-dependent receptor, partial [Gammaproteobacteria bacterium]